MATSGISIDIEIDDAQVRRMVQAAPGLVVKRLRNLVEGGAIDIQGEMRRAAPAGVGGGAGLRGSIRYAFNAMNLSALVAPTVDYAQSVEEGAKPHWTSVAPGSSLRAWANLKGISPYAVQRSIAKKGTKAHPYVKPTYEKMGPVIKRNAERDIASLAKDLNDGRL